MECFKCLRLNIPKDKQTARITVVDRTYTVHCAKCGKMIGRTNHWDDIGMKIAEEGEVKQS